MNIGAAFDESWKVHLIEQDFHTLMFDVEDVLAWLNSGN